MGNILSEDDANQPPKLKASSKFLS